MGIHPYNSIIYGWATDNWKFTEQLFNFEVISEYSLKKFLQSECNHYSIKTPEDFEKAEEDEKDRFSSEVFYMFEDVFDFNFDNGGEYSDGITRFGVRIYIKSNPDLFIEEIIYAKRRLAKISTVFTDDYLEALGKPKIYNVVGMG